MHDIRAIRENPEQFDKAAQRRGLEPVAQTILALDKQRREIQTSLQAKLSRRNEASREIGQKKAAGGDADELLAEVAAIKEEIPALETKEAELEREINTHLISIPNILDDAVPDGADEQDNEVLRSVGEKPAFSFTPRDHVDIGEGLGQMDFAAAAKLSGARFVVLQGQLARLSAH